MSKLETLIQQLCPDGVAIVPLKEVAHYSKMRIDAAEVNCDNYVGVENLLQNKLGRISASTVPEIGKIIAFEKGNILIGNIRPYLKKIWLADCSGGTNGDVLTVQIDDISKLLPEFLYYVLSSDQFFMYDVQNSKGAKMPRGSKEAVMNYGVPVPPLEIQHEIVRILDNFTELTTKLTAELTAELTARKKQYEYYKNKLLGNLDVEGVPLKMVCNNIFSGKNKMRLIDGKCPVYGSTGIISTTNIPVYNKEQILIARVGANAGFVHIANGEYDVSDNTLIVDLKEGISLKYVYYQLSSMNLHQYAKGGGQPLITAGQIKELKIVVPSLEKQLKIVSILDRFDALCNDLVGGLPAEIAAQQKQYEYYRDKLLIFQDA